MSARTLPEIPELPLGLRVEAWPSASGGGPHELADWRTAGRAGQGVIWLDIGLRLDIDAVAGAIDDMGLADWDRGFLAHVVSGFGPDEPSARTFSFYCEAVAERLRQGRPVRFVAPAAFTPQVGPGPYEPPWVFGSRIAILASPRWVITRRQTAMAGAGSGEVQQREPYPLERLSGFARARWTTHHRSGEDLALLFLRAAVDTHGPAVTSLLRRLSDLQLGYVRGLVAGTEGNLDDRQYREALLEVHWVVETLAREVFLLLRPGTSATQAWFPVGPASEIVANEIAELLERTERAVDGLRRQLSDSFALASSTEASQQLVLSRRAQEAAERSEHRNKQIDGVITAIATVLLGPGLVVAVFGALPGIFDKNESCRAISMGVFAVAAGAMIYLGLRLVRSWVNRPDSPAK